MDIGLTAKLKPELDERQSEDEADRLQEKLESRTTDLTARLEAEGGQLGEGIAGLTDRLNNTFERGREAMSNMGDGGLVGKIRGAAQSFGQDMEDRMMRTRGAATSAIASRRRENRQAGPEGDQGTGLAGKVFIAGAAIFALREISQSVQRFAQNSPFLEQTFQTLGMAIDLFLRPIGNTLAQTLFPISRNLLALAMEFNEVFGNNGLIAALSFLADRLIDAIVPSLQNTDSTTLGLAAAGLAFGRAYFAQFIPRITAAKLLSMVFPPGIAGAVEGKLAQIAGGVLDTTLTEAILSPLKKRLVSVLPSALTNISIGSVVRSAVSRLFSSTLGKLAGGQILKRLGLASVGKIVGSKIATSLVGGPVGLLISAIDLLIMGITALIPGIEMMSPLGMLLDFLIDIVVGFVDAMMNMDRTVASVESDLASFKEQLTGFISGSLESGVLSDIEETISLVFAFIFGIWNYFTGGALAEDIQGVVEGITEKIQSVADMLTDIISLNVSLEEIAGVSKSEVIDEISSKIPELSLPDVSKSDVTDVVEDQIVKLAFPAIVLADIIGVVKSRVTSLDFPTVTAGDVLELVGSAIGTLSFPNIGQGVVMELIGGAIDDFPGWGEYIPHIDWNLTGFEWGDFIPVIDFSLPDFPGWGDLIPSDPFGGGGGTDTESGDTTTTNPSGSDDGADPSVGDTGDSDTDSDESDTGGGDDRSIDGPSRGYNPGNSANSPAQDDGGDTGSGSDPPPTDGPGGSLDPGRTGSSLINTSFTGLAEGGVVTDSILAMVGEGRESEAVLPLSKLDSMLNNSFGGVEGGQEINPSVSVLASPTVTLSDVDGGDSVNEESVGTAVGESVAEEVESIEEALDSLERKLERLSFEATLEIGNREFSRAVAESRDRFRDASRVNK